MSQNSVFRILKIFFWIHTSLAWYAHWSYFWLCVQYGPQKPNLLAILGPKVSKHSGIWSLSQKVFTVFTSVLLNMLVANTFRCVKGPNFGATLGPQRSKNSSLIIFSKNFYWFCVSLGAHVNVRYVKYWPQRPNLRVILSPQIDHNSGLQSFSETFSIGFTFQWCAPKALFLGQELKLQQSL